jgi:hypothetical protein
MRSSVIGLRAERLPRGGLGAEHLQHAVDEGVDQPRCLGDRDELVGGLRAAEGERAAQVLCVVHGPDLHLGLGSGVGAGQREGHLQHAGDPLGDRTRLGSSVSESRYARSETYVSSSCEGARVSNDILAASVKAW